MDLQKLLSNLNEVKSLFEKCDKCKKICDEQHKIICGHFYCARCILSINSCIKCGIKYNAKDIYVNRREEDNIIKQFNDLQTLLEYGNIHETKPSSLETFRNTTERELTTETINETDLNNINYSACDCVSYLQIKQGVKQTRDDKKETIVNKKNAVGETKLFHACKKGNEKEVQELLDAGALFNVQDYAGWTPLHEAVYSRNLSIVENLLKLGSVVNAPGDLYDTPLHKAVETCNPEMVSLLIKYGADINSRNYEGNTPVDVALPYIKETLKTVKSELRVLKIPETAQKFVVYILGEKQNIIKVINRFNNKLMPITNTNTLNENVTHVISTATSKLLEVSYELLQAIALQIPVISHEWLTACISLNEVVNYEEYFIIGISDCNTSNMIYKSQINKYKMNPKLFSGCHFYIANSSPNLHYKINDVTITKEQLIKLIMAAGGKILKREPHLTTISSYLNRYPWHAEPKSIIEQCCHYIIYIPTPPNESRQEMKYNMKELRHVPYTWLFDCILQYKLINPVIK